MAKILSYRDQPSSTSPVRSLRGAQTPGLPSSLALVSPDRAAPLPLAPSTWSASASQAFSVPSRSARTARSSASSAATLSVSRSFVGSSSSSTFGSPASSRSSCSRRRSPPDRSPTGVHSRLSVNPNTSASWAADSSRLPSTTRRATSSTASSTRSDAGSSASSWDRYEAQPGERLAEQVLPARLRGRLLHGALRPGQYPGGVPALVSTHRPVGDLPGTGGHRVEEPAVVRDDDQGASARPEVIGEPGDAGDVEGGGGLGE